MTIFAQGSFMNNHHFIPSVLQTKSCASLEAQVAKELNIPDPEKTIAQLIDNNNEEKTDQNPEKDQDQTSN